MIIIDFIPYSLLKHILGLEKDKVASELEICFGDSSLGCGRTGARIVKIITSTSISTSISSLILNCGNPNCQRSLLQMRK